MAHPGRPARGHIGAGSLVLLVASLFAGPGVGAGPPGGPPGLGWSDIYRAAVASADLEDWAGVEARIQEVLHLKPEPDRSVRLYGMWHTAYMPYYYLGLAQHHMGRPKEALESFNREEAAGVVQHDPVAYLKLTTLKRTIQSGAAGKPAAAAGGTPAPPATAPGADPIFDGLQHFFKGDYGASISAFQEALKRSRKDDLTLHLYLGMAYAGKASVDKAQEQIWKNMAFLEFQRVHSLDPGYTLSSGVFSEEMVGLFEEAGKKP